MRKSTAALGLVALLGTAPVEAQLSPELEAAVQRLETVKKDLKGEAYQRRVAAQDYAETAISMMLRRLEKHVNNDHCGFNDEEPTMHYRFWINDSVYDVEGVRGLDEDGKHTFDLIFLRSQSLPYSIRKIDDRLVYVLDHATSGPLSSPQVLSADNQESIADLSKQLYAFAH